MRKLINLNRIKRYLKSIRGRILFSTLLLTMLFSTILAAISYYLVSTTLENNLIHTSETGLSFLSSSITSNIENVTGFIQTSQRSSAIRNYCQAKQGRERSSRVAAVDYLTDAYYSNSALRDQLIRFAVVSNGREDMIQVVEANYSTTATRADKIKKLPYITDIAAGREKTVHLFKSIEKDPFLTNKSVDMIPLACGIDHPYQDEVMGYGYAEMSTFVITEPMKNYLSEQGNDLYIIMEDTVYLYSEGTLSEAVNDYSVKKDLSDEAIDRETSIYEVSRTDTKGDLYLVSRPLEIEGMYVSEMLSREDLKQTINDTFALIVILIMLLAIIIFFLLSQYLNKTVNKPVGQLTKRMERIEAGDFSRDSSTEWDHELGQIGRDINDLSENVLRLMNQRIDDERQKRDYEYKMLQSQINPHFLYNTLNSIKWMATIQNAPGIAEMTTSLSRLLKDISKGTTNIVSIEHELSLIKDYFTIQQYRYGGTITLNIDVEDEAILKSKILKFTLQPIVENAIFHGIEPKGTAGRIDIKAYFTDSLAMPGSDVNSERDVCIEVLDDGIGMEEEMCRSILLTDSQAKSSFFKEIGVSSVNKRLQYEFGEMYGMSVESKIGEYTKVTIRMPYSCADEYGIKE